MVRRARRGGKAGAALLLLVAGCIPHPRQPAVRTAEARETPEAFRQCVSDLRTMGAEVQPLPDRVFPNGCSATAAVKLVAIGIPVTNLGAVKCGLARPFVGWVRQSVQPAARQRFGSAVARIESLGSFACRPVNNVAGNALSEHGRANAVDIAAVTLADGRRVTAGTGPTPTRAPSSATSTPPPAAGSTWCSGPRPMRCTVTTCISTWAGDPGAAKARRPVSKKASWPIRPCPSASSRSPRRMPPWRAPPCRCRRPPTPPTASPTRTRISCCATTSAPSASSWSS